MYYLIGLLVSFFPLIQSTNLTDIIDPPIHNIIYTNSGYNSDFIEVSIGVPILFWNQSDFPMWTASDPHPLHTDFSSFDARRAYAPGGLFVYVFKTTGTYAYHNHEKSNHRGIIRVIDPSRPFIPIDKTKESLKKTRDKFLAMLDPHDDTSISHMIRTLESDTRLSRNCHDMSHDLGHRAYELFGFSRAMTWSNGNIENTSVDDVCAGGYMHGILEELFLHHPELQKNPETVCSNIPEKHQGSCYHGVGHGVMFSNKRDVEKSLLACRTMSNNIFVYRCFEGVWMEMFWGDIGHAGSNSLGWSIDDPFARCKIAKNDEKPTCYLYAHLGYLRSHIGDFTGVVKFCTKSDISSQDSEFCLKGIGITMMKHFTSHHLEKSESLVKNLSTSQKSAYYEGIIGYAILSSVPRVDLNTFCSDLRVDTPVCLKVLKNAK
ncbi:hypothetical protein HOO68_03430 [Candidatus Gracilibacteria bacterium]|nr:hypothetical protein [Candidatus Gracilibacteria bacterium]